MEGGLETPKGYGQFLLENPVCSRLSAHAKKVDKSVCPPGMFGEGRRHVRGQGRGETKKKKKFKKEPKNLKGRVAENTQGQGNTHNCFLTRKEGPIVK